MAAKKAAKTDFKAKAKATASRAAAKRKRAAPKKTQREKSEPNIDTSANAELESNDEVSDADVAFVEENASSLNFLSSVDPATLAAFNKEEKKKRKSESVSSKAKKPAVETVDSEDDVIGDYSDSDLEIHSDDEEKSGIDNGNDDDDDSVVDFVLSDSDTDADSGQEGGEEEEEEDTPVNESDEYVYRNSKIRRAEKRKALLGDEMDYEQQTRTFEQPEKKAKVSDRLPIKTSDGRLVAAESSDEDEKNGEGTEEPDDDVEMDDAQSDSDVSSESPEDSELEAQTQDKMIDHNEVPDRSQLSRKQYIVAQQNRLAVIADKVMQDLEANMSGLKHLHAISDDNDPKVKQLGLLTQLAVY
ncbi:hypothetical protein GGI23_007019, partial [Coemansia sp. RSA 2559]